MTGCKAVGARTSLATLRHAAMHESVLWSHLWLILLILGIRSERLGVKADHPEDGGLGCLVENAHILRNSCDKFQEVRDVLPIWATLIEITKKCNVDNTVSDSRTAPNEAHGLFWRVDTYRWFLSFLARFRNETGLRITSRARTMTEYSDNWVEVWPSEADPGPNDYWLVGAEVFGEDALHHSFVDFTGTLAIDPSYDFSDIPIAFRHAAASVFSGQYTALPLWLTSYKLLYRRDIFAERNISVPQTWDDVIAIANQYGNGNLGPGQPSTAFCFAGNPACGVAQDIIMYILATMVQLDGPSHGTWFDPDTLEPLYTGVAMREALRIYRALKAHSLPDYTPCSEVTSKLASGQCLMLWGHSYAFKLGSHTSSSMSGRQGVTRTPGSTVVLNRRRDRMEQCTRDLCPLAEEATNLQSGKTVHVNRIVPLKSASFAINAHAPAYRQAAAFAALHTFTELEEHSSVMLQPTSEVSPIRYAELKAELWTAAGYAEQDVRQYLEVYTKSFESQNVYNELRIPGVHDLQVMMQEALVRALDRRQSDDQILAFLANGTKAIIRSVGGTNAVRLVYQASIDFTPASQAAKASGGPSYRVLIGALVPCVGVLVLLVPLAWLVLRRLRLQAQRHMRLAMAPGPGPLTTLLVTDIQDSTMLWESLAAELMDAAVRTHHRLVRELLLTHHGYESATEGDSFILAFHKPDSALAFALAVQEAFLVADWPPELIDSPHAATLAVGHDATAAAAALPYISSPALREALMAHEAPAPRSSVTGKKLALQHTHTPHSLLDPLAAAAMRDAYASMSPSGRRTPSASTPGYTPSWAPFSAACRTAPSNAGLSAQSNALVSGDEGPAPSPGGARQGSFYRGATGRAPLSTESLPRSGSLTASGMLAAGARSRRDSLEIPSSRLGARRLGLRDRTPPGSGSGARRQKRRHSICDSELPQMAAAPSMSGAAERAEADAAQQPTRADSGLAPLVDGGFAFGVPGADPTELPGSPTPFVAMMMATDDMQLPPGPSDLQDPAAATPRPGSAIAASAVRAPSVGQSGYFAVNTGPSHAPLEAGSSGRSIHPMGSGAYGASRSGGVQALTLRQLLLLTFPEVPPPAEGAGGSVAAVQFRGLRVRVGLHCGPSAAEVQYNAASSRTTYPGRTLQLAKAVSDAGRGGQVTLSSAARRALDSRSQAAGQGTLLLSAGSHVLKEGQGQVEVVSVFGKGRLARAAYMDGLRSVAEKVPGVLSAPLGRVALALAQAQDAEDFVGWGLESSLASHRALLGEAARLARQHDGYLLPSTPGSFQAAFTSPAAALHWLLQLQADVAPPERDREAELSGGGGAGGGGQLTPARAALVSGPSSRSSRTDGSQGVAQLQRATAVAQLSVLRMKGAVDVGPLAAALVGGGGLNYAGAAVKRAVCLAAHAAWHEVLASAEAVVEVLGQDHPAMSLLLQGRSQRRRAGPRWVPLHISLPERWPSNSSALVRSMDSYGGAAAGMSTDTLHASGEQLSCRADGGGADEGAAAPAALRSGPFLVVPVERAVRFRAGSVGAYVVRLAAEG